MTPMIVRRKGHLEAARVRAHSLPQREETRRAMRAGVPRDSAGPNPHSFVNLRPCHSPGAPARNLREGVAGGNTRWQLSSSATHHASAIRAEGPAK
jgi:hypothetical protein